MWNLILAKKRWKLLTIVLFMCLTVFIIIYKMGINQNFTMKFLQKSLHHNQRHQEWEVDDKLIPNELPDSERLTINSPSPSLLLKEFEFNNNNRKNYNNRNMLNSKGSEIHMNELLKLYKEQQQLLELQHKEIQETQQQITRLAEDLKTLRSYTPRKYPKVQYLNYKTRKRILVTGGAGFVGSHLVDVLMMAGHEVIIVDNFFTGRKRNVEHWLGHENFELIHHDIVNSLFIEVDEIYHLASPASPPHYMFNPVKTIKTNTMGTINILGLAKRVMAKVLIASTSEVYGDPTVHPQPETYWGHVNPIGPRACYDEGKRVSETLSYAYAKQENVQVRVARIFNTYGPRMHMNDGRVVSNFILQALRNETITVYGNGKQTRSFQYVSDLVDGLIALMASNYTQPINLGNPVEHTIEEFALIIKDLVGGQSVVKQTQAMEDDPQRRRPDITRAKKYLNWQPKVPLQKGLQKTIAYFRKELERSSNNFDLNDDLTKYSNNIQF